MNLDNIIEKRKVNQGSHSMVLEISSNEYNKTYGKINNDIAAEIVSKHLNNREDDGRATNIKIDNNTNGDIIRIHADLHYLGNDHTGYSIH